MSQRPVPLLNSEQRIREMRQEFSNQNHGTHDHPQMIKVREDIQSKIDEADLRNGGDKRWWEHALSVVDELCREGEVLDVKSFSDIWPEIDGMPVYGLMNLNIFTLILGGSNKEWYYLQKYVFKTGKILIDAMEEDIDGLTVYKQKYKDILKHLDPNTVTIQTRNRKNRSIRKRRGTTNLPHIQIPAPKRMRLSSAPTSYHASTSYQFDTSSPAMFNASNLSQKNDDEKLERAIRESLLTQRREETQRMKYIQNPYNHNQSYNHNGYHHNIHHIHNASSPIGHALINETIHRPHHQYTQSMHSPHPIQSTASNPYYNTYSNAPTSHLQSPTYPRSAPSIHSTSNKQQLPRRISPSTKPSGLSLPAIYKYNEKKTDIEPELIESKKTKNTKKEDILIHLKVTISKIVSGGIKLENASKRHAVFIGVSLIGLIAEIEQITFPMKGPNIKKVLGLLCEENQTSKYHLNAAQTDNLIINEIGKRGYYAKDALKQLIKSEIYDSKTIQALTLVTKCKEYMIQTHPQKSNAQIPVLETM